MRAVDIIIRKRDHLELSRSEIDYFIHGYARGEIQDYQAAAWAMAVLLNGMTERETTDLALAMAYSGEVLDLNGVVPVAVDKHSTGGVGDKTTLVVEPCVAACGLPVGKMSGRGLGFSGGTLDKIESIPGYQTKLSTQEFIDQLSRIGLVLCGQTADLAPADGKLYALRDVTGTIQSIPLIASSIMSKKLASGAEAIVLDVKIGRGAFMPSLEMGKQLSAQMVTIARLAGRRAIALLSDMNQPLGLAVGNALEVREAIDTLHGDGPSDFYDHCMEVAGHMLALGSVAVDAEAGKQMAVKALNCGKAWEKFRALVIAQGGDIRYVDDPTLLPRARYVIPVCSPASGYLATIDARIIGEASVNLGAGRAKKEDDIDHSVGLMILNKVGDFVEQGQPLFVVHANSIERFETARDEVLRAFEWSDIPVPPLPLFYDVIK